MNTPQGDGSPRTTANRVWATAAAGGVALLLVAAATTAMTRERPGPRGFGSTSRPAAPVPTPAGPSRSRQARVARPAGPGSAPMPPAAPAVVTIPVLAVRAVVVPVGTANRQLEVPTDPAQLGWWTASARVGAATGTVVIDGHVDSAATGPGALFRLQDLHASDRIVVATTTAQRQTYVVTGRRVYDKGNGLPPELFTTGGAPRLVLITCGGPFDPATGSYLDNIVVFATPT